MCRTQRLTQGFAVARLTAEQLLVMELICQGYAREQIAVLFGLEPQVVTARATAARKKLGAKTQAGAVRILNDYLGSWMADSSMWQSLSPTQRNVANLMADGFPDRRIAEELGMAVETVRSHRAKIFRRLGITSRRMIATRRPGVAMASDVDYVGALREAAARRNQVSWGVIRLFLRARIQFVLQIMVDQLATLDLRPPNEVLATLKGMSPKRTWSKQLPPATQLLWALLRQPASMKQQWPAEVEERNAERVRWHTRLVMSCFSEVALSKLELFRLEDIDLLWLMSFEVSLPVAAAALRIEPEVAAARLSELLAECELVSYEQLQVMAFLAP